MKHYITMHHALDVTMSRKPTIVPFTGVQLPLQLTNTSQRLSFVVVTFSSSQAPVCNFQPSILEKQLYSVAVSGWEIHTGKSKSSNGRPLIQMACKMAKSIFWFNYRAGKVTASQFKQVLRTDPPQPSLSFSSHLHFTAWYLFKPCLAFLFGGME